LHPRAKKRNREIINRFVEMRKVMAISSVTAFELYAGAENYEDKHQRCSVIDELLALLEVIPLDAKAASAAGEIHRQVMRKGMRIGSYDVLNAGLARARNLTIATNNLLSLKVCRDYWWNSGSEINSSSPSFQPNP
jgi:tRNA(fMet)-specific endonuclease VapC